VFFSAARVLLTLALTSAPRFPGSVHRTPHPKRMKDRMSMLLSSTRTRALGGQTVIFKLFSFENPGAL
jgi:hypothetical protein